MAEVAEVCDRILFMQAGKIVADDTPESLAKSASRSRVELILNEGMDKAVSVLERLSVEYSIDHRQLSMQLDEPEVARVLTEFAKHEILYSSIQIHQPTLQDYFFKMVKQTRKGGAS
jgi:ABC-type multidrug transport system ATPase subunit